VRELPSTPPISGDGRIPRELSLEPVRRIRNQ